MCLFVGNIHLRVHCNFSEYDISICVARMQTLCYVLVLLLAGFFEGSTWKNSVADEQKLLQNIFGGIMEDNFPLKDIYFTLLPDGVPKNSTLYRFNLTYGKIVNIGKLLTPKKEIYGSALLRTSCSVR
nr:uncharacterized protein LOC126528286 isoform X3 [Dermacentor andersoni]